MDWQSALDAYFASEKGKKLWNKIEKEYENRIVYPAKESIFKAFDMTPLDQVRVVILGQDPYHQPHQAQGLAFSVEKGQGLPPSLRNIYKELFEDLGITPASHGDLSSWAQQGVFLLNTSLTVVAHQANSHKDLGWDEFTDYVLSILNDRPNPLVFVLWGKQAQAKKSLITHPHHYMIESAHPSPLSAYRGFFGSRPFSKINAFLGEQGIDWEIK